MFRSVKISRFRGFRHIHVEPFDRFNLILGRNNVGKTALLESLYLLVGPTNPELPLRLHAFRGIEQFRADPEEMWGWLFFRKEFDKVIELEARNEQGRSRSLKLTLAEPKGLRVSNGRKKTAQQMTTATTTESPPDLILKFTGETGEKASTRAFLQEQGNQVSLAFDREKQIHFPTSIYMTARAGYSSENPERFSKLEEVGGDEQLVPALKQLEPRLQRLVVLVTGGAPMIHGDLGLGRLVPVPLMGDGFGKLLTLLLAVSACRNGVVLVDEIDTGLYYSSMRSVWNAVARVARIYNVQIFATTHSWECIRAAHESFSDSEHYDLRVHRLDRRDDDVEAISYDQSSIRVALESGMELR